MAILPIISQTKINKFDALNFRTGDVWTDVATLVNGNIVATWESKGQYYSGLGCVARVLSQDGNPITDELIVYTYTSCDQVKPKIVPLKDGGFVIVWRNIWQTWNAWGCYGQLYNEVGEKVGDTLSFGDFEFLPFAWGNQASLVATSLSDGGFATAWLENGNEGGLLRFYMFSPDGGLRAGGTVNNTPLYSQEIKGIAGLENGGLVVAWAEKTDDALSTKRNYFSIYDKSGNNLIYGINFSSSPLLDSACPIAAIDDGFALTWTELNADENGKGVFLRIFDNGGNPKTQRILVNSIAIEDQQFCDVVYLGNNRILVSWEGPGDSGKDLYAKVFSTEDGSTIVDEYRLNIETIGTQRGLSLSRSASGDPVVAWNTSGTNSSEDGIYLSIQSQPKESVVRGNSLYTIVDGPSWTEAEANSVKLGGHLVTIENAEENALVLGIATQNSAGWIGLSDPTGSNNWVWSSNSTGAYRNWAPGQPNYIGIEKWAAIYYGNIDTGIYDGSRPGDWGNAQSGPGMYNSAGIAETPFIRRGDSAYVTVQGPTWEEAEANAVKLGGHLVTINDAAETEWITNEFSKPGYYYEGDSISIDPDTYTHFWLGATQDTESKLWSWLDGSHFGFDLYPPTVDNFDRLFLRTVFNLPSSFSDYTGETGFWWNGVANDISYQGGGVIGYKGIAEIKLAPNSTPTGTPTLSGTLKAGQVISIDRTRLQDADNFTGYTPDFKYSWEIAKDPGMTQVMPVWESLMTADSTDGNETFTITADLTGKLIRGVVSYLDGYGTNESVASAASSNVIAPSNTAPTALQTLRGSSKVGRVLTADKSTIVDPDGVPTSLSYGWEVSTNGNTWTTLTSADATDNNSTYALTAGDLGKTIRSVISYTDGFGANEVARSAATTAVVANAKPTSISLSTSSIAENIGAKKLLPRYLVWMLILMMPTPTPW